MSTHADGDSVTRRSEGRRRLQTGIAQALQAESDPKNRPWERISAFERRYWRRLADAALGALRHQEQVSWVLYNPTTEAYRMRLDHGDDVLSREEAVERMAPYHHGGDGFEVVEQRHEWWTTGVFRVEDAP